MKTKLILVLNIFVLSLSLLHAQHSLDAVEGLLYSDGEPVSIKIVDGKIADINYLPSGKSSGIFVAPGLIDIQLNGYMGVDFSDLNLDAENMKLAIKSIYKTGVTTFLPTVVTNDPARIKKSFQVLSGLLKEEEIRVSVPGFHLEGPYISPVQGFRGAHLEKYIKLPDWKELSEFQAAAQNKIRLITVAPELKNIQPFIRKCAETGMIVSLGHHNGNAGEITSAVNAGASLSTHLGNGCANMIDRHLNPLWPQLANDQLTVSLIVDGFHLNREEVRVFYKAKGPAKTILVSDAVDLAGLPPGEYTRREKRLILTPDNVIRFPAENVLAGAATPLSICVGNMMKFTACSLADAIRMASTNPANLLSLHHLGEIKLGKRADLILFRVENNKIEILKTIVAGKVVYSKEQ